MILDFPAIEAMQEASEAAGWECEYRQLDAGRLKARIVLRAFGEVSFLRESASRRLSIVAESPADAVTIVVPTTDARFRINGVAVTSDAFTVVPAQTDFHSLSDPGADALSMHVSQRLFNSCMKAASVNPQDVLSAGVQRFEADADTLRRLCSEFTACADAEAQSPLTQDSSAHDQLIINLLQNIRTGTRNKTSLRRTRERLLVAKVIAHIDEHLNANIRVVDLCQVAGVSLSTLERMFHHDLMMTPVGYIRARRLDAVRRSLMKADPGTPIAQVAHNHGIWHLGRFAADYRRQFGALPSEDRPL